MERICRTCHAWKRLVTEDNCNFEIGVCTLAVPFWLELPAKKRITSEDDGELCFCWAGEKQ
jgi:hypothetical protein